MNDKSWQIRFGIALFLLSIVLFILHFLIFGDLHHILIFGIHDIAFLPLEVLLVTVIIHQMLVRRERTVRMSKLNMVIGAFYSEVGTELLAFLSDHDPNLRLIREQLCVDGNCSKQEFEDFTRSLKSIKYKIEIEKINLDHLKDSLLVNKDFMLRLLENPNLLEHEDFTGLLLAVFHLTEEFKARGDLRRLPATDLAHLEIDINRVYGLLVHRWLDYMRHMKASHPYLFSLYVRTNPFDKHASPIVTY